MRSRPHKLMYWAPNLSFPQIQLHGVFSSRYTMVSFTPPLHHPFIGCQKINSMEVTASSVLHFQLGLLQLMLPNLSFPRVNCRAWASCSSSPQSEWRWPVSHPLQSRSCGHVCGHCTPFTGSFLDLSFSGIVQVVISLYCLMENLWIFLSVCETLITN